MKMTQEREAPTVTEKRPASTDNTILVVDNDPLALELLTRVLIREGYRVVTAESGAMALAKAKQLRPVAITLDVDMPDMDGWAVLAALRADPALAPIPVIMVSMLDERNKAQSLRVTEYLLKPIQAPQLKSALGKLFPGEKPRTEERSEQRPTPEHGSRPVLVVEDDHLNREILARLLRREGRVVVEAENGRAALSQAVASPPDLILLDLTMPVMDGFTFVKEMQQVPTLRSVPIIVVTARDLTNEDRSALSGIVSRIFQKGAHSRDELLREIRKHLAAPTP